MNQVASGGNPSATSLLDSESLLRLPARITMGEGRAPGGRLRIAGLIRSVSAATITLDLFVPLPMLQPGAQVVLEIMSKTALIQCHTAVLSAPDLQSIVLLRPETVYAIQRRRHPRVQVSICATVSPSAPLGGQRAATIMNLSQGGCALVLDQPVDAGTRLTVTLQSTGSEPTSLEGKAVRLSPLPSGQWEIGVAFVDLTADQRERLLAYLNLSPQ
ncbi:MAG: flagellar brake protein [Mycobacterium leprae]